MNRSVTFAASHLVALALGGALAWPTRSNNHAAAHPAPGADSGPEISQEPVAAPSAGGRPIRTRTPAEATPAAYRRAWDLLQRQSAADRAAHRLALLAEWADLDLAGALEAALTDPQAASLLDAFAAVFEQDPERIAACFANERFGLNTALLRSWWIGAMRQRDPEGLYAKLDQFGPLDQGRILSDLLRLDDGESDFRERVLARLSGLPDNGTNRGLWAAAATAIIACGGDLQAVIDRLAALPGPAGTAMVSHAMAALLEKTDYRQAKATYAMLTPDLRAAVVRAELAKKSSRVEPFLAALDEVINSASWQASEQTLCAKFHDVCGLDPRADALLGWAAKLPERDDTLDLYRVAVRGFVTHRQPEARTWIEAMPAGWKRENSLAAYAQSALSAHRDPAQADWAISRMRDPKFRTMAEGWITYYEQTTGRKYPR